ncbi:MAG: hypothetical protein IT355_11775 [Gemmatimonadaceae bacterium]|nr:hypothetical protein [Gemmatimonadaceae bacterium]
MTWLAPWALAAGALGMLGVVAAHLLSRQRPRALALATARFLPAGMLEATTIQPVPRDRWWMLLRLGILALLALAVAQPVRSGATVERRTVLLLDRTLPAADQRAARAVLAPTDAVIAFDTSAALSPLADSTALVARRASLSAALALLGRLRDSLARGTSALHVTLASRMDAAMFDPATESMRALLPEPITVLPVPQTADDRRPRGGITVRAEGDDPIAATAQLLGDSLAPAGSLVVRGAALTASDSAAARRGGTVVHWPVAWTSTTAGLRGLTVQRTTWVAPLAPDTAGTPAGAAPVGWWEGGQPAVWLARVGTGCVLHVRATLPAAGDQTLSLSAQAWLVALLGACEPDHRRVDSVPAWLAPAPASRAAVAAGDTRRSTLAPWLAGGALLLAALELLLRARRPA